MGTSAWRTCGTARLGQACWPRLFGTLVRLSGWSLAAGVSVGYLVTALYAPRLDTVAAGYMTILGAESLWDFLRPFYLLRAVGRRLELRMSGVKKTIEKLDDLHLSSRIEMYCEVKPTAVTPIATEA